MRRTRGAFGRHLRIARLGAGLGTWFIAVLVPSVLGPRVALAGGTGRVEAEPVTFAVGLAPVFELRRDFGADARLAFSPELVGETYLALRPPRLFLRPGLRLGFDNVFQAEMPGEARVTERGVTARGEAGLLFDGPIIPALSLGIGVTARWVAFDFQGTVARPSRGTRLEWLPALYAQLGVGVPTLDGALVFEPFLRVEVTAGDDRSRLRFGFDTTIAF